MGHFTQSDLARVQRELEALHRQLADEASKEASLTDRIVRLEADVDRASSISMAQSKSREVARLKNDVVAIHKRRADASKRIAAKQQEFGRHQLELVKDQTRERTGLLETLTRQSNEIKRLQTAATYPFTLSRASGAAAIVRHDAFICHASEDKEEFVRPLAEGLIGAGFQVWYDEFTLKVGDSLRRSIDRGLAGSRFGIVVLSLSFFAKNWPQYELDGLVAKEIVGGKVVLPIWHRVTKDDVIKYSPTLADRVALSAGVLSLSEIVDRLADAIRAGA